METKLEVDMDGWPKTCSSARLAPTKDFLFEEKLELLSRSELLTCQFLCIIQSKLVSFN